MIFEAFMLFFLALNACLTIFFSKKNEKAIKSLKQKMQSSPVPPPQQSGDIHSILQNRLLDIQKQRYSLKRENNHGS